MLAMEVFVKFAVVYGICLGKFFQLCPRQIFIVLCQPPYPEPPDKRPHAAIVVLPGIILSALCHICPPIRLTGIYWRIQNFNRIWLIDASTKDKVGNECCALFRSQSCQTRKYIAKS